MNTRKKLSGVNKIIQQAQGIRLTKKTEQDPTEISPADQRKQPID